jgi:ribulose-5-phosphate 4-epimerase/fuculose-1-phosphate aldolase
LIHFIDQGFEVALLKATPVIDQQMVKVNIQRNTRETSPPGTEATFHFQHLRMAIGKPVYRTMILQPSQDRSRQPVLIDTACKITQQITDGRFNRRLRQYEVSEMIHGDYYKSKTCMTAIEKNSLPGSFACALILISSRHSEPTMSISAVDTHSVTPDSDPHYEDRVNLAAAFRMTARLDMHESVANHFSFAVSNDGSQFLVNPLGRHFSNVRASELLLLDANDDSTMDKPGAPDPTAWAIHGAMHRNVPQARCVLHVHSKYATVLASIQQSGLPPIDQNTMRFFNRVSVDDGFDGMGLGDEAERLTTTLGSNRVLIMGNHGVMTAGETIAIAFDELYYFERACSNYITALMTGKPLRIVSDEVAEKTARQWDDYIDRSPYAEVHLREVREILDREEPDYKL